MGIIRAVLSSADTVLHEQWREFFYCDSMSNDTLLVRGRKRIGERSVNTNPNDEIITNGSILSIADGQCAIVVSQGKVIDCCSVPGGHLFEDPNHPGGFGGFMKDVWSRVGFGGGDVQPIRHRIYYVNTKECSGVRFDTPAPIPVHVRDTNLNADLDLPVRAGGVFSYRIKNPLPLYRNLVGNIEDRYSRRELNQLVSKLLISALAEAIVKLAENGVRPYTLAMHTKALGDTLIAETAQVLSDRYGLELVSIAFDTLIVEDRTLTMAQRAAIYRDPAMVAASMIDAVGQLPQQFKN